LAASSWEAQPTRNHQSTSALPSTELAPALARRRVAVVCNGWPQSLIEDALTMTSELVTNAVRHGRSSIVLTITASPDLLHVEVADENPNLPVSGLVPSDDGLGGRGLLIVAALSTDWGSRPSPKGRGKAVWFSLQLP
jgi:anti-sigma regulatory factor (Ser/Thr protein kinase)